ncbi:MAG TPA: cysteine--tRNA ligase [Tepidisphaeraceae bacterium]|jgi:cysteinyl-tRNA synthetase|nr:cysteine--tRNA ligase [Tepidisphaeraceae bacterium]
MTLRVYNTLSKQKELFQPVKPGEVGMYVCGPTVYKPPHMGHLVGPVIFDAVKRYLQYKGFKVTWIVNITDVDDKLIVEAANQNTTVSQIAERCTKDYLDVLAMLGIDTIDRFPKASEHIGEIIALIEKLIAKDHAYAADGNVWFAVGSDSDYGKLSHRNTEEQEAGTRDLEGSGKRSGADFALWKAAKPGEPMWDSPWGRGRPGWHIECSAMSMKYLGESFDLHGGGMDLLFPHHENELAQSESASDKPFVKYWMHNGLTRVATKTPGGQTEYVKESKSLGNIRDARKFIGEHGADFVRYLLLSTHYRSPIDFSEEVMASTKKGQQKFQRLFERIERLGGQLQAEKGDDMDRASGALLETSHAAYARAVLTLKVKFLEAMDDDFNTAGAIAALHEMAGEVNGFIERNELEKSRTPELLTAATAGAQSVKNLGAVLGLFNAKLAAAGAVAGQADPLPGQLMQLVIGLRAELRKAKNFALADQLRKDLTAIGITLEDRADGTIWRRE